MTPKAERWHWVKDTLFQIALFARAEVKRPVDQRVDWADVQQVLAKTVRAVDDAAKHCGVRSSTATSCCVKPWPGGYVDQMLRASPPDPA